MEPDYPKEAISKISRSAMRKTTEKVELLKVAEAVIQ